MSENVFKEVERTTASLDNHVEELHRAILGAQRLIRAYDRAAHYVITSWENNGLINWESKDLKAALVELQRVYERRQV